MTTVLVTGAGTAAAQGVMKALRRQEEIETRVIAVDADPFNAGRHLAHVFHAVPRVDDPAHLDALLAICSEEKVAAVMPMLQSELLPLSRAKAAFRKYGCTVIVSEPAALEVCLDKLALHAFLQELEVQTPNTLAVAEWLAKAGHDEPVIVKPRRGTGSRGVRRVMTASGIEAAASGLAEPVVQPFLSGAEYSVDVLCDLHGCAVAEVARTREVVKDGASIAGVTVDEPGMRAVAMRIAEALPIVGPCNVQFIRTADGVANIIDVNPRFGGASIHSFAAGLDAPLLLLKLLAGRNLPNAVRIYRIGLRMRRYWEERFEDEVIS
jgi:carbamoyl-phosphate synthase large subunit